MFSGYEGRNGSSSFEIPSDKSPSNGCVVSGGGSGGRGLSGVGSFIEG